MAITIHIPSTLRSYCDLSASTITVVARSIPEAMSRLKHSHIELHNAICDETGAVRQHVNLFVNDVPVANRYHPDESLSDGDNLFVFPAVSGG